MIDAMKDLVACGDVRSLESALRKLCSEFGPVSHLAILTMTDAGKRRAVCLVQLDSWEQEQNLMTKLGAGRLGEDLCVVVDLGMQDQEQG